MESGWTRGAPISQIAGRLANGVFLGESATRAASCREPLSAHAGEMPFEPIAVERASCDTGGLAEAVGGADETPGARELAVECRNQRRLLEGEGSQLAVALGEPARRRSVASESHQEVEGAQRCERPADRPAQRTQT